MTTHRWEISIRDNGGGFADGFRHRFAHKIESRDFSGDATEEGGGIGLLNIWHRLHLFYNEKADFSLSNAPEGGAIVTIGGWLGKE